MMDEDKLFTLALGLVPPWLVDHVTFTVEEKRLDLHINFPKGSRLACPEWGSKPKPAEFLDCIIIIMLRLYWWTWITAILSSGR